MTAAAWIGVGGLVFSAITFLGGVVYACGVFNARMDAHQQADEASFMQAREERMQIRERLTYIGERIDKRFDKE